MSAHEGPGGARREAGRPADLESTVQLVERARAGDPRALDDLFARHLRPLQRWARGRLPRWARDLADTGDLVQETLLQTFRRLDAFEPRGSGALQAYLRQAVLNRIRNELRRAARHPAPANLDDRGLADGESPLESAIGGEAVACYERALERLRPEDREAVIARVEMGYGNEELAAVLGKPTAEAARKAVQRALVRLAGEMGRAGG
jgi:RNA polymerase sigma-70 factor (ECF subfamily)